MRRLLFLIAATSVGWYACNSSPPSITAITLFPSGTAGQSPDLELARTLVRPPIPVLAVRPGADPEQSSLFLNHPVTGQVSIQLGIGLQNFLLFAGIDRDFRPFTLAAFLDGESTPALACQLRQPGSPLEAAADSLLLGLDGRPVAANPVLSVVRHGFRVSLQGCTWPLGGRSVDVTSPWLLQPDNVPDQVGVLSIDVEREQ